MIFSIGEQVVWSSQAQGHSKQKSGEVVAYVPPNERPCHVSFPDLYKSAGVGWGRSIESYVVRVGTKHYWPITKKLRRAGPSELEQANERIRQLTEQRAALLEALAGLVSAVSWERHGECRSPGWPGPPPKVTDALEEARAAIALVQGDAA